MSGFTLTRKHDLSFDEAKKLADGWAKQGETDLGMSCKASEKDQCYVIEFKATGAEGELRVLPEAFELEAKLGFLFRAFESKIRSKIEQNLDELLGPAK